MIVPVYNLAGCIAAALNSLRAQSWTDFEALIIDDGSTDGSAEVARAACAGDARFTVIVQDNQGLSGARNTGLDRARGDVIGFLDGDDRLHPEFLARMLAVLDGGGTDWVACGVQLCYPDGHQTAHSAIHAHPIPLANPISLGVLPQHFDLRDLRAVVPHFPSAWNKLYRRTFIGDVRFDLGTWFEDHSFYWRLALRAQSLTYLPQPLYLYSRDRPGQITGADDDRVFDLFAVLDRVADLIATVPDADPGHGQTALAMLTSRLIHERLSVLRAGPRRARFVAQARDWLAGAGLEYTAAWDADLCRAGGLLLRGTCPVSVVLWSGADRVDPDAVAATLQALQDQTCPELELILSDEIDISAMSETIFSQMTLTRLPYTPVARRDRSALAVMRQILSPDAACAPRGAYLILLQPGDLLAPQALQQGINQMERTQADLGIAPSPHGGADCAVSAGAAQNLPMAAALWLHTEPAAKILRRAALGPLARALHGLAPVPPAFAAQALALLLAHLAQVPSGSVKKGSDMAENAILARHPAVSKLRATVFGFPVLGFPVLAFPVLGFPALAIPQRASFVALSAIPALFRDNVRFATGVQASLPAGLPDALPPGWPRLTLARALQVRLNATPHRWVRAVCWGQIALLLLWTRRVRVMWPDGSPPAPGLWADHGMAPRLVRWLRLAPRPSAGCSSADTASVGDAPADI